MIRRFRAPVWAWLLTLLLVALFLRLGFWQLQRAEQKKAILSAYLQAAKAAPLDLNDALRSDPKAAVNHAAAVLARGVFEPAHTLLLDNQVSRARPGVHVWSPLVLDGSGAVLLVDRGWIPVDPDRRRLPQIPTPPGRVSVRGVWQPLPRPGMRLGSNECAKGPWPHVVEYPLHGELQCLLGARPLLNGVLWLDPAVPDGFEREWAQPGIPPERHYGYALQWFGLAITLIVIFIVVNLRRRTS